MSTEQSESAPAAVTETKAAPAAVTAPQVETKTAPAADTTQQATTPTTTTQRVKNPKRVAAGKMVAERTRLAREEQKKASDAYNAEKQAKAATVAPKPAPDTKEESPNNGGLSTNQWIAIGGVGVYLLEIYYKREELMAIAKPVFDKFKTPKPASEPAPEPVSVEPKPARDTLQGSAPRPGNRPRGLKKII